jgi:hypothetical protein
MQSNLFESSAYFSLGSKIIEHRHFLNMGMSILGFSLTALVMSQGFPLLASPIGFCSIGLPISSIYDDTIPEFIGLSWLKKVLKQNQNKLLPFKGNNLSFEQNEANKISKLFVASMFLATYDKGNFYQKAYKGNLEWFMNFSDEQFNDHKNTLLPIYEKHFKHTFILVKSFLNASTNNNLSSFSKNLFINLFPIHNYQLSNEETKYLQKHFDIKKISNLSLLTSEKVFKILPFDMQKNVLEIAKNKIADKKEYNALVLIHNAYSQFEKMIL